MTAQNLKKSLLNYAISGKLSANWRKKNLNSRIPNDVKSRIPSDFNPPFEIPNSWQWVKLGDLGEYKKGPFGSSLTKSMFVPKSENSIKVYEQKNAIQKNFELGDYFITKEYFLEKMQGFIIKPNDIIISCAGTIGEVYRIPKEAPQGIINQALMRVRLNDLTIFEWFIVAFNFVITANSHQAKGTAIKNIPPFSILKSLYIPLPPKNEQEFIVNELERLMSLADSYEVEFQKLENCKKELRNLKKSLLNYAISGKLSANWRKKNLNSRIPNDVKSRIPSDFNPPFEIPNSWQWVKLRGLGDIITGSTPPKANKEFYGDDYPFYKPSDLDAGIQVENSADTISKKGFEASRKLPQNSILVTCIGATIGKTGLILKEGICNQQINAILPNEKFISKFLFFAITSEFFQNEIKHNASSTTLPILNKSKFSNLYIPLPPLDEQERIVKKIDELFEILEVIENSL